MYMYIYVFVYVYILCVYVYCITLQHTAIHHMTPYHTVTSCNTLQHAATCCNMLQHAATHCTTLQHIATHYNALQHPATHCNVLQCTAAHCSTLQRTETPGTHSPGSWRLWNRVVRVRNGAVVRDTHDLPPPSSCIYERRKNLVVKILKSQPATQFDILRAYINDLWERCRCVLSSSCICSAATALAFWKKKSDFVFKVLASHDFL